MNRLKEKPVCPHCKRKCSVAGGVLGTKIMFYKCFTCGYEIEDAEYEILDNKSLPKDEPRQDS